MSPRQSRSPSPSIHYKKLPFRVASFRRPGSNVPTLPAGLSAAQGAPTRKNIGRRARRMRGGNHHDTPAIRGIFDSRILLVALSTEGPVMTGLSAEVSAPPVAADQHAFSPSIGGLLINIDNGGTSSISVSSMARMFTAPSRWRYGDFIRINAREVATSMGARTLPSTAKGFVLALPRSTARSKRFRKSRSV
jgi:hypothetical protein